MRFSHTLGLIAIALCLGRAYAQSTFGEIRGTVTDPSGSVIVGAAVYARLGFGRSDSGNTIRPVRRRSPGSTGDRDVAVGTERGILLPHSVSVEVGAVRIDASAHRRMALHAVGLLMARCAARHIAPRGLTVL